MPGNNRIHTLAAWWNLTFSGRPGETAQLLGREIPVGERDVWASWLAARQAEHRERTAEIVRIETELNARVYALFGLTADEIRLVEESMKYRYA